jgi:hypothetical protein
MRAGAPAAFVVLLAACGSGAVSPNEPHAAACAHIVRGACVTPEGERRYCGPLARWDGACLTRACEDGHVQDEVTGECLGARALRAIAQLQHVTLDGEAQPACREGLVLRVATGHARCDTPPIPAPRDRCGPGRALDGTRCVELRKDGMVDASAWARAVLGEDGGAGSPWLCARVGRDPFAFGLVSGAATTLLIDVELIAPDNDVTLAHVRTRSTERTTTGAPRPLAGSAEALVARAVDTEVELFRALGGTSNAGAVTSRVKCVLRAGSAPHGG